MLRFRDASIEREFRDIVADSLRPVARSLWSLFALVLVGMAWLDAPTLPRASIWAVRYGIVLPVTLVAAALAHAGGSRYRRSFRLVTSAACAVALDSTVAGALLVWAAGVPVDMSVVVAAVVAFSTSTIVIDLMAFDFVLCTSISVSSGALFLTCAWIIGASRELVAFTAFWLAVANVVGFVGGRAIERHRRRDFVLQRQLAEERARSDVLLRNVLPESIAERLKLDSRVIADAFPEVTILFADIVGFTALAARLPPEEVVALLNRLFTVFDDLTEKYGLEKIKTIGDAYMVVGGLPEPRAGHAAAVAEMAIDLRDAVARLAESEGSPLRVRIGIHTGPVVAGVIGKKKFSYDLWGDAVNVASRLESHGLPDTIHVSDVTARLLGPTFETRARGLIPLKGKGEVETHFLVGRRGG